MCVSFPSSIISIILKWKSRNHFECLYKQVNIKYLSMIQESCHLYRFSLSILHSYYTYNQNKVVLHLLAPYRYMCLCKKLNKCYAFKENINLYINSYHSKFLFDTFFYITVILISFLLSKYCFFLWKLHLSFFIYLSYLVFELNFVVSPCH